MDVCLRTVFSIWGQSCILSKTRRLMRNSLVEYVVKKYFNYI